jgi:hypothetical protein
MVKLKFEKIIPINKNIDPTYSFPQLCPLPPPRYAEQNLRLAASPSNNANNNNNISTTASLENISPSIEPPTYNSVVLESSLQSNNMTNISIAEETCSSSNKSSKKKKSKRDQPKTKD